MDFAHTTNATGHQLWTVNDSAFRANYNHPVLPLAAAGNTSYAPEWNVYTLAGTHGTARIVMYNNSTMAHVRSSLPFPLGKKKKKTKLP